MDMIKVKTKQDWKRAYENAKEQLALLKVLNEMDTSNVCFDKWGKMIQLEQAIALYENGRRYKEIYSIMMG